VFSRPGSRQNARPADERGDEARLRLLVEILGGADLLQASAGKDGDPVAKDAAIIAAAQRIEHYEIAAYGTARTLAGELDQQEAGKLFGETLDEESAADKLLTKIATGGLMRSGVNQAAKA